MPVGRKQSSSQAEWLASIAEIRAGRYPWGRLDALIDRTLQDIRDVMSGRAVAFGWSGGKDSLALASLMARAGHRRCVFVMTNLEYPAFLAWVTEHMPDGLEVVNTEQDLRWLAAHPEMLFPQDSATARRWFRLVQHTGQERYYRKHRLDVLVVGRRRADGNQISRDGSRISINRRGIVSYSPISDWAHEDVLALIERERIGMPPTYGWPRGFQVGTGPWPARQWTGSIETGWREVHEIDPSIVRRAAAVIPSARQFLVRA